MYPGAIYLLMLLVVKNHAPARQEPEEIELKDYDGLDYKPPEKPKKPDLRRVK